MMSKASAMAEKSAATWSRAPGNTFMSAGRLEKVCLPAARSRNKKCSHSRCCVKAGDSKKYFSRLVMRVALVLPKRALSFRPVMASHTNESVLNAIHW